MENTDGERWLPAAVEHMAEMADLQELHHQRP